MRFDNPQTVTRARRGRHRAGRRAPARSGSTATSRCSRRSARCSVERGRASTTTSSTATPPASTTWRDHISPPRLGRRAARHRAAARADRAGGASCSRRPTAPSSAGRWASPSTATRSRRSRRSSTSRCCRATSASRAPGCARCAGTPTCRATARWASGRSCPTTSLDALRQRVRLRPAARARPRHRRHDPRDARRRRLKVFVGLGGNFVGGHPRHRGDRRGDALGASSPCRSRPSSTARTCCPGAQTLILPCLGRTEKDVRRAGWQGVTVEDSMSSVHAVAWGARAGQRAPALRGGIVCRIAEATLGSRPEGSRIDWDAMARGLHGDPPPHRARRAGLRRLRREGGAARRLRAAARASRHPDLRHALRQSRVRRSARWRCSTCRRATCCCRRCAATTSSTPRSTASTTATAGIAGGRHVVIVHPDDLAQLGLEPEQVVDVVSVWEDGSERVARDYRLVSYPTPRGCAAAYYPECNVLVPLDSVAIGSNSPRRSRSSCGSSRPAPPPRTVPVVAPRPAPTTRTAATSSPSTSAERGRAYRLKCRVTRLSRVRRPLPAAPRRPAAAGRRGRRRMP